MTTTTTTTTITTYTARAIAGMFDNVPGTPHGVPARLPLHLLAGETAWNPADEAAPFHGPLRVEYQRHHASTWALTSAAEIGEVAP